MTQTLLSTEEFHDFSEALRMMRQGKKMRRAGWVDVQPYANAKETDRLLYIYITSFEGLRKIHRVVVNWETDTDEYFVQCWKRQGLDTMLVHFSINDIFGKDWYEVE